MKELILFLKSLLHPFFWLSYGIYSKSWDTLVREQLRENAPVDVSDDKLGNIEIELNGRRDFGVSYKNDFIPYGWDCSRRTKVLLRDRIEKNAMEEYKKLHNKLTKAMK